MAGYHSILQAIGAYDPITKVFTGASLAASITSQTIVSIGNMLVPSVTVWVESGTPNGTFYVDVTNDMRAYDPGSSASAKWVNVQNVIYTSGVDPNSNSASHIVWTNGAKYARVRWVFSSGTGTGGAMFSGVGQG